MSSVQQQGYLSDFVTVDEDPLVVDYRTFDPTRLEFDAPKEGKSKKGDSFFTCRIRYRYLKRDGTEQISMLKVKGPIGWAHGGVIEKIDEETKTGTGKYSYPMEISSADVEGKGFLELLDKLYKRLLQWYLENKKAMFPRKGFTDTIASKRDPTIEDNHLLISWEGCNYPYKIQLTEGQEDKVPDVYTTSFWSQVQTDGKYATKFYDVEPVVGENGEPERDENGKIRTIKKRLGPEVYMEAAIKGRPIWVIRDWFVGAKMVIRKKLDSVLVSALAPKTQGFQLESDAQEEAERRVKASVDPIKSMINTILKSTYGKKPAEQKSEIGNVAGFSETNTPNPADAFRSQNPFPTAAPSNSKTETTTMQTPVTEQPPVQQPAPTQFNPQAYQPQQPPITNFTAQSHQFQQFPVSQQYPPTQFNPQAYQSQGFGGGNDPSFNPYNNNFDGVMAGNQRGF